MPRPRKDKPPHPGRTPAQRRALDAIGNGDLSPRMSPRTRDALLRAGLIVRIADRVIGRDRFGVAAVARYAMAPRRSEPCRSETASTFKGAAYRD